MLYMRNSYKQWERLMKQTSGSYYINEKHIQKWVAELEQVIRNEYRLFGQSYLSQMTALALKDKSQKIPYALYEIYRYMTILHTSGNRIRVVSKVFSETRYECRNEEREHLQVMLKMLEKAYARGEGQGNTAEQDMEEQHSPEGQNMTREQQEQQEQRQRQLQEQQKKQLQEQMEIQLKEELSEGREKNRMVLEEELKLARKSLWEKMMTELEEEKQKAREEIQLAREEALKNIKEDAKYELRLKEEENYLRTVADDIERREQFEEEICRNLHSVSGSFNENMKGAADKLLDSMNQIMEMMKEEAGHVVEEMRHSTANAINQVVDTERKIRKDDFDPLLRNFAELQELMYYTDIPEEAIGLERTKISHYARRFLKVLNRLGYEEYLPEQGEAYDTYYHTADVEPEEDGDYEVQEAITYGFCKEEEVCLPAKVVIRKRVL